MKLSQVLPLERNWTLAFVGAGGKTTALFQLAHEVKPSLVTTTTHLGAWQTRLADQYLALPLRAVANGLVFPLNSGVTLVTGPEESGRIQNLEDDVLTWLRASCRERSIPLLIEADGARQLPLKAPGKNEPAIPDNCDAVMVVAGLSGLGKPLTPNTVHRPEIFSRLSGIPMGDPITSEGLYQVLNHPEGGVKNIPAGAKRYLLLNQADTPELQDASKSLALKILPTFETVVVASLLAGKVFEAIEPIAGIILAAGDSQRFGSPKQILEWKGKPLVRHAVEAALGAGLSPIIIVTGKHAEIIIAALQDLPVIFKNNPDWKEGQSSSLKAGLNALPKETSAAIFLLADQPHVNSKVIRTLMEKHWREKCLISLPLVKGKRSNPVLFDKSLFPELLKLTGDTGGRALFSNHPISPIIWENEALLMDVDTPDDYLKLIHGI